MKLCKQNLILIGAVFVILLLMLVLIAGPSQARYNNAVSWTGIYDPGIQTVSSDYLTQDGQTVILQPWRAVSGAVRTKEIMISTDKGMADVVLQCSTDSPYLTAELDYSTLSVTQSGCVVNLKMTLTDAAQQIASNEQAKVAVTLQSINGVVSLKADFQVTLLPDADQPGVRESELDAVISVSPNQEERTFAWKEKMIFTLTAEENADQIELMFNGDVFPKKTCYTVQNKHYILGDDMTVTIPVTAASPQQIILDFSRTGVAAQQIVNITATAYLDNQITGQIDFAAYTTRKPLALDLTDIDPVISGNGSLSIPMTGDEEGLTYRVECLTKTDDEISYVESEKVTVQILQVEDEDGQQLELKLSNTAGQAPAGTYRVTLIRTCGDVTVSTCQMVFFIHY